MIKCDEDGVPTLIQSLEYLPNYYVWRVVYFNGFVDYVTGDTYDRAYAKAMDEVKKYFAYKPRYTKDSYYQRSEPHDTTPASL